MRLRIGIVFALGLLAWLFVVRVSMPACKTDRWWAEDEVCCPQECIDAYSEARAAGTNEMTALMDSYGADGTCGQTR
jgi:hypothetical protein